MQAQSPTATLERCKPRARPPHLSTARSERDRRASAMRAQCPRAAPQQCTRSATATPQRRQAQSLNRHASAARLRTPSPRLGDAMSPGPRRSPVHPAAGAPVCPRHCTPRSTAGMGLDGIWPYTGHFLTKVYLGNPVGTSSRSQPTSGRSVRAARQDGAEQESARAACATGPAPRSSPAPASRRPARQDGAEQRTARVRAGGPPSRRR